VTPGGHRVAAQLIGSDATSGVAVLRIGTRLAPAHFARTLSAGQLAMIDCLCDSPSTTSPSPTVTVARVDAVGVRPGGHLLDAIEADHVRQASWGTVLTDSSGSVAGILDTRTDTAGTTTDVFVPGWLASAVAEQLATSHKVVHGWLGITPGAGQAGGCGAVVGAVLPGGAASRALSPGEVVVAVDGHRVCSWPELQASLYVMQPNQQVELQVDSPDGATTVAVALSPTPG
jgi:S1-C subfamily serine protease